MDRGYEVIKDCVDHVRLQRVWMELHFLVSKQLQRLEIKVSANMLKNLEALLHVDSDAYVATLSLASRLMTVCEVLATPLPFVRAACAMPVMHIMANTLKVPNGYWGTEAHQDWASTQGSLRVVTVWIPITNTKDNFPLEVVPDSHQRGFVNGEPNGSVLKIKCADEFVKVDAQFGDMVLLDGFIIHRTGKGGGLRIAVSIRYEDVTDPTWAKRKYYSAQKRAVDRDVKWNPTPEQIRAAHVG